MNWIALLKACFHQNAVFYTQHARKEMEEEEYGCIGDFEVCQAVENGEVIEIYKDDTPLPSCLIYGQTDNMRPLHVVCAYDAEDNSAIIITTYQPDPEKWYNYRKRKPS